eukprot:171170-Chlamydomonas_euryale.AAC.2
MEKRRLACVSFGNTPSNQSPHDAWLRRSLSLTRPSVELSSCGAAWVGGWVSNARRVRQHADPHNNAASCFWSGAQTPRAEHERYWIRSCKTTCPFPCSIPCPRHPRNRHTSTPGRGT